MSMVHAVVLSVSLLVTTAAGQSLGQPWPRHVVDDSSRGADGVRLADIDGDGLPDITTGWEEGGVSRVYVNPGPAQSREKWPAVTVGKTPSVEDAVFADLDDDGAVDVVSCCEGRTCAIFVHWAPQDKSRMMSSDAWRQEPMPAAQDLMQWMFACPMQVDGVGGVDLVAGGKNQDAWIGWLESPANPRDTAAWKWRPISKVGWVMSIIPHDMDSDGDLDIVLTDRRGELRGCRWLENPGPEPPRNKGEAYHVTRETQPDDPASRVTLHASRTTLHEARSEEWPMHFIGGRDAEVMFMTLADLDGDGLQDVLIAAKEAHVLYFRRLDSSGRRWSETRIPFPQNMGTAKGIAVGDIDLDGHPDIVISCEDAKPPKSGVKWLSYRKSPFDPNWQGHEISGPSGVKFDRIELLDLDGDGDLDVLTCEENHNLGVIWYENPHRQTSRQGASLRSEAAAALRKAVAYFRENVATQGGYLWRYSEDLSKREGEGKTDDKTVWLQPPGTPAVGMAFLQAYWDTGDSYYLDAALSAGACLVRGQLRSGGWADSITFDPAKRRNYAYRVDGPTPGRSQRDTTTLDDDKTQSAVRLLMHLDATVGFKNEIIHESALYALNALLKAQFPNGAWPQQFNKPPDPNACPVLRASYPQSWPREFPGVSYSGFYTFNDNAMGDVVEVMALAFQVYKDPRHQRAVERVGDFILLAQMPDPQPAWAQQYDRQMHPAWARKFEPAAITGGESQGVIATLLGIYEQTGRSKYLDTVPKAIEYLRRSQLPDGRLARFYELRTNRPLYCTKDYVLTYSDEDVPTHYAFQIGSRLDALEKAYKQMRALPASKLGPRPYERPKPSHPSRSQVQRVIDRLDDRGRWVEQGRLRYHGEQDPTDRIIDCRTFINNCRILSNFLATEASK